jgi:predicted phosphodiesterase
MKLAVVSDIHGNLPALEAVLADTKARGVERIVNLGDSLSGPLLPRETAQFLMQQSWPQLAGNHERQVLSAARGAWNDSDQFARSELGQTELAWLASLPPTLKLPADSDAGSVFLCHAVPHNDLDYFLETAENGGVRLATRSEVDARVGSVQESLLLCGHTHSPRALRSSLGQWIVNPGSVGWPAYSAEHPCKHAMQTGSPDARYAIVEHTPGGWVVQLLSVPYDHGSMAALARKRPRPDWEHALLTGYALPSE